MKRPVPTVCTTGSQEDPGERAPETSYILHPSPTPDHAPGILKGRALNFCQNHSVHVAEHRPSSKGDRNHSPGQQVEGHLKPFIRGSVQSQLLGGAVYAVPQDPALRGLPSCSRLCCRSPGILNFSASYPHFHFPVGLARNIAGSGSGSRSG